MSGSKSPSSKFEWSNSTSFNLEMTLLIFIQSHPQKITNVSSITSEINIHKTAPHQDSQEQQKV